MNLLLLHNVSLELTSTSAVGVTFQIVKLFKVGTSNFGNKMGFVIFLQNYNKFLTFPTGCGCIGIMTSEYYIQFKTNENIEGVSFTLRLWGINPT